MKPNLPDRQVFAVLADKNMPLESKKLLRSLNIKVFDTVEISDITDSTSTHPDMQFVMIAENTALVCSQAYSYYKNLLPGFNILSAPNISSPYPNDCKLNFAVIAKTRFTSKHHISIDGFKFNEVYTNQGYTKCNICILNEKAILTSDAKIGSIAENNGFRAYIMPSNEIALKGYKNGFWGGTSGLIDKSKLFFNGNIKDLTCYKELMSILDQEKIEPIYSDVIPLTDIGSILPLY